MRLISIENVEIFEYKKNNNRYQNKVRLYKQVVEKALFITNFFDLEYILYF